MKKTNHKWKLGNSKIESKPIDAAESVFRGNL